MTMNHLDTLRSLRNALRDSECDDHAAALSWAIETLPEMAGALERLYSVAGLTVAAIDGDLDDDMDRYKQDITAALDESVRVLAKARGNQ